MLKEMTEKLGKTKRKDTELFSFASFYFVSNPRLFMNFLIRIRMNNMILTNSFKSFKQINQNSPRCYSDSPMIHSTNTYNPQSE